MKWLKLLFLTLTLLSGFALGPAPAEDKPKPKTTKVKTLIDYKSELGLSDKQVKEIKDTLFAYQNVVTEQRKALSTYEKEYSGLVSERAPLEQIKGKLRQITDTSFNLRFADVQTARKVETVLTADQLKKWRDIQAKVRQPKSGS